MGLLDRIRSTPQPIPEREPLSVSGRGHVDGFLQLEELNIDLMGRQGLEKFDEMYFTDGDIRQVISLLVNPIVAGTWTVEPASGALASEQEREDAEFVQWALFENMTPNLAGHLMEALPVLFRAGFSPFEAVWTTDEWTPAGSDTTQKVLVPRGLYLRLPRTIYRWKQDVWGGLEAIEQYLPVPKAQVVAGPNVTLPGNPALTGPSAGGQGGVDDSSIQDPTIITDTRMPDYRQTVWLPAQNLVYYRVGAEGDNWEGRSLLRPVYKHWWLKNTIEKIDAIAQEREAMGIPICYPPLGATADQFDAMESVMKGIRSNEQGYILMPGPKAGPGTPDGQGWLVEIIGQSATQGGRDPQPSLRYHTDKIAAAFIAEFVRLGHNMTGGGSRATAGVQQDPFLVGVEAIVHLIEDVLNNQLVAPIMAYNRPNAKSPPVLKMSLVDATSLTQLADFILKLAQVGALMPDQELEDFVRARADLPPSDPDAVKERGSDDDAIRREIIMGAKGNGPQAEPGVSGGSAAKGSGANSGKGGSGGGSSTSDTAARATAGATLDSPPDDQFAPYLPGTERVRWRPVAWYELASDLDGIEDHLDAAPAGMMEATRPVIHDVARHMSEQHPKRISEHDDLRDRILSRLEDHFDYGAQTVGNEIERRANADTPALDRTHLLDRGAIDRGRSGLARRASVASSHILDEMHHAVAHADLGMGSDPAKRQAAAERAGVAAARRVGHTHTTAAFQQGRHDTILAADNADDGMRWGVRYTAILDKGTCDHCRAADDGQVRALDDPVRMARRPPNPECESTASGRNMCRCFEIPEQMQAT